MSIPWRDRIATLLVATATLTYILWLIGPLEGLKASSIALVVMALGVIASASAVVPGFANLLSGSRWYLAMASFGGLVALVCGVLTVTQSTQQTLGLLVVATIGLWVAATIRHARSIIRPRPPRADASWRVWSRGITVILVMARRSACSPVPRPR